MHFMRPCYKLCFGEVTEYIKYSILVGGGVPKSLEGSDLTFQTVPEGVNPNQPIND